MQHLTEEQLVLHHYHDGDAPFAVEQHLAACGDCREQFDTLRRVLALVSEAPLPERDASYGSEVWQRMRWKLGSRPSRVARTFLSAPRAGSADKNVRATRVTAGRSRAWVAPLIAAAAIALAFIGGILWHSRQSHPASAPVAKAQPNPEKLLVLVVGDHLENSERMLTELTNADPSQALDLTNESRRAEELVASNRIYRQAATQRGDTRMATLLSDLEPVLTELAHADGTLSPSEVSALQKRIESKGLLFKVRVASARGNQTL